MQERNFGGSNTLLKKQIHNHVVYFFKGSCKFFEFSLMQERNFDNANKLLKNKFIIMSFVF